MAKMRGKEQQGATDLMLSASKEDLKLTADVSKEQVISKSAVQGISGRRKTTFGSRDFRERKSKGIFFGGSWSSFKKALENPKKSFSNDRSVKSIPKKGGVSSQAKGEKRSALSLKPDLSKIFK